MGKSDESIVLSFKFDTSKLQDGKTHPVNEVMRIAVPGDFDIADAEVEVMLDARLQKRQRKYNFSGNAKCGFKARCSGCLASVSEMLEYDFSENYSEDAGDDAFLAGSTIDLKAAVEMNLFLNLPATFWCKDDCMGLCPVCGINLNEGVCSCDDKKNNGLFDGIII